MVQIISKIVPFLYTTDNLWVTNYLLELFTRSARFRAGMGKLNIMMNKTQWLITNFPADWAFVPEILI